MGAYFLKNFPISSPHSSGKMLNLHVRLLPSLKKVACANYQLQQLQESIIPNVIDTTILVDLLLHFAHRWHSFASEDLTLHCSFSDSPRANSCGHHTPQTQLLQSIMSPWSLSQIAVLIHLILHKLNLSYGWFQDSKPARNYPISFPLNLVQTRGCLREWMPHWHLLCSGIRP